MNVCRTCVGSNSEELVPIFSKMGDQFIASVIVDCSSIAIFEDDGLPCYVCQECLESVQMIADFAAKVRESDRKLRQLFKSEVTLLDIEEVVNDESEMFSLQEVKIEYQVDKVEERALGSESGLDFEDADDSDWNDGNVQHSEEEVEAVEVERNAKRKTKVVRDSDQEEKPQKKRQVRRRSKKKLVKDEDDDDDDDNFEDEPLNGKEQELYEVIRIDSVRHICCWCCMDFDTKEELAKHGIKHREQRKRRATVYMEHGCEICYRRFKRLKSLQNHLKMTAALCSRPIYQCKRCEARFIAPRRRRLHVVHHEKEDEREVLMEINRKHKTPVCCSRQCYLEFESEKDLLEHGRNEHIGGKRETLDPKLPHECPVCFKCYETKKGLYRHRNRIYYGGTQCSICGKEFKSRNAMVKHERMHNNDRPYGCEICGKRFAAMQALKHHMLVHNDEKPFVCSVCGWGFKRECNLKIHVLIHSETLPFKCEVCEKSFKGKYHLQYHMRTHTGNKPYKCQYCDKHFAHHANRTRHEISHTGIKPHKCNYCEKSYIRKRQLVEHESTHTGIDPYRCEMCNRRFGQKEELEEHLKVHPKAPENKLSLPQDDEIELNSDQY